MKCNAKLRWHLIKRNESRCSHDSLTSVESVHLTSRRLLFTRFQHLVDFISAVHMINFIYITCSTASVAKWADSRLWHGNNIHMTNIYFWRFLMCVSYLQMSSSASTTNARIVVLPWSQISPAKKRGVGRVFFLLPPLLSSSLASVSFALALFPGIQLSRTENYGGPEGTTLLLENVVSFCKNITVIFRIKHLSLEFCNRSL